MRTPILNESQFNEMLNLAASNHSISPDQLSAYDGMGIAQDFYEDLINTGKLRIVKEVELWHPSVPEETWREWLNGSHADFSMLVTKCCSKNPWTPPWLLGRSVLSDPNKMSGFNYPDRRYVCPGCGNSINR